MGPKRLFDTAVRAELCWVWYEISKYTMCIVCNVYIYQMYNPNSYNMCGLSSLQVDSNETKYCLADRCAISSSAFLLAVETRKDVVTSQSRMRSNGLFLCVTVSTYLINDEPQYPESGILCQKLNKKFCNSGA